MPNKKYHITGSVIDKETGQGFEGLLVRAYDKDIFKPDQAVASARTDENAQFQMAFDSGQFKDAGHDPNPDVYFKVYLNKELVESTENDVLWNLKPGQSKIAITVDGQINQVNGRISQSDGLPAPKITVQAFQKKLREESKPLGSDTSNEDGHYCIIFSDKKIKANKTTRPTLIIKAFAPEPKNEKQKTARQKILDGLALGASIEDTPFPSMTIYNAKRIEKVDLNLGMGIFSGPSEYERLKESIEPLLDCVSLTELRENEDHQDITYLTEKSGENPDNIQFLAVAEKYAEKVRSLVGEDLVWNQIFYGLMRNGLPVNLHGLLSQGKESLKAALHSSLIRNIIPQELAHQTDQIVAKFPDVFSRLLSEPSQEDEPNPFYDIFKAAELDEKQRKALSDTYIQHNSFEDDFWNDLGKQPVFENSPLIGKARAAVDFGSITGFNTPLVQKLFENEYMSAEQLVRFDQHGWMDFLDDKDIPDDAPGTDSDLKRKNYARALTGLIEDAFPTKAFVTYLRQKRSDDTFDPEERMDLLTFFENSEKSSENNEVFNFELHRHAVNLYLEGREKTLLDGVGDKSRTIRRLKQIQRVFKLLPDHREIGTLVAPGTGAESASDLKSRFDCVAALLKEGLDSAYKIVHLGKNDFVNKTAAALGGAKRAAIIHGRARKHAAMAMTLFTRYTPSLQQVEPSVIKGPEVSATALPISATQPENSTSSELPATWRAIFGSVDFCECKHCRSVLSPAAYLVDILNFLADRSPAVGLTAKDVLFKRRPDIGQIELTCKNTNTVLPYIDLVNEVLENAAIEFNPFDIDPNLTNDLDNQTVSEPLQTAFLDQNLPLVKASIRSETPGQQWTIEDKYSRYSVVRQNGILNVRSREALGLQTRGTTPEIEANPENVNPAAYLPLQKAVFPWNLPADVWLAEARSYLEHLGVQRHELMKIFFGGPKDAALADISIAGEHLGLAKAEREIIDGSPGYDPWVLWGIEESGNDIRDTSDPSAPNATGTWDVVLRRISIFQKQSDLKYPEIQELLDAYFINPVDNNGNRVIDIWPQGSENDSDPNELEEQDFCNLSRLHITGPTGAEVMVVQVQEVLAKIPRFVRLWRKIGWTMQDIDRAITALQPLNANGDVDLTPDFLIRLSHIERLRSELNLSIPTILSWWADIDTAKYIDREADGQPDMPSLYAQLFQNRSVDNPVNEAFALNSLRDELQSYDSQNLGSIRTYQAEIAAALEISAEDFSLIFDRLASEFNEFAIHSGLINDLDGKIQSEALLNAFRDQNFPLTPEISIEVVTNGQEWHIRDRYYFYTIVNQNGTLSVVSRDTLLNLANLSALYRYASLAKALDLSARNFLSLLDIVGENPFSGTLQALSFVEKVALIKDSVFSIEELDYLLRHRFLLAENFAPSEDEIRRFFNAVLDGLQQIRDETESQPDASGELTRSMLARVVPADKLEQTVALVNGRDSQEEADSMRDADERLIDDYLSVFLSDLQEARNSLLGYDAALVPSSATYDLQQVSARYDYILRDLLPYLRRTMTENLLIERIAAFFGMESAVVSVLLSDVIKSRSNSAISAMQDLLSLNQLGLTGSYYQSTDWTGNAIERVDPQIDFDWGTEAPIAGITGGGPFSVRWSGKIAPRYDEIYTFYARTDDGVKLTVNKQIVIDNLQDQSVKEISGEIELKSGRLYDISVEYYNRIAEAVADLRWSSPSTPKEIVPRDRLLQDDSPAALLYLFHKVALIVNGFQMQPEELRHIDSQKTDFGNFDFNDLPLTQQTSPSPDFNALENVIQFYSLKNNFIANPPGLFEIVRQLSDNLPIGKEVFFNQLNELNRWALQDLQALLGSENDSSDRGHLVLTFPDDYRKPDALARLLKCFQTLRRLGTTATQVIEWTGDTIDFEQVDSLKKVVRSKYDEAGWQNVARPISDRIRELRRDALSAFIIDRDKLRDKNELYAHYLIDVEMSACQMTSRMVQALSSCQLFVMRCLMNLEPEVVADAEADQKWRRWEWMQRYRVWEANRKVFLYPENWIYPELRDDKTPFFQDLETELLQSEVTEKTAESAFLHYLEKLRDVARLEVMGIYHEQEETPDGIPAVDILHVFARTYSTPHAYYYRKRINSSYWTPWEAFDLDIQGNYLIPVIWNRRLYLCWPIFTEKQEEENVVMPNANEELPPGARYLEIQLAWSELKGGEWSSQSITDSYIRSYRINKSAYVFDAQEIDGDLWINVNVLSTYDDPEYAWLDLQGKFHFLGCENRVDAIEERVTFPEYCLFYTEQVPNQWHS